MSSSWWIGITTKAPIAEEKIRDLVKVLFDKCHDIGFTPLRSTFLYFSDQENIENKLNKKPTEKELSGWLNYLNKGSVSFAFNGGDKEDGFDGTLIINNMKNVLHIWFWFNDYIARNKKSVNLITELCESAYKAVDGFYAYVTWESGTKAKTEITKQEEFKKIYENYKKTGKTSYDIKTLKKEVEKEVGWLSEPVPEIPNSKPKK